MRLSLLIAFLLALPLTANAQQKLVTFQLKAQEIRRFNLEGIPEGTRFHVKSSSAVTVFFAAPGMTADEMLRSPCNFPNVLEITVSCDAFTPSTMVIFDTRQRDSGTLAAGAEALLHKGEATERLIAPNIITIWKAPPQN